MAEQYGRTLLEHTITYPGGFYTKIEEDPYMGLGEIGVTITQFRSDGIKTMTLQDEELTQLKNLIGDVFTELNLNS